MEKLLKNTSWSSEVYSLRDIFNDFSFPAVLKLKTDLEITSTKTLHAGDVITVHGRKTIGVLKGSDSQHREVSLPTTCTYQVKFALPDDGRVYRSVKELCLAGQTMPKFVEVQVDANTQSDLIQNGDRLKVLLVEKGANGPLFMHFRNERGKHVRLSVDIEAIFTPCPPDNKLYFLSEIATKKLPVYVQFPAGNPVLNESTGVIEIKEGFSIDLVLSTTTESKNLYAFMFQTKNEATFEIAQGLIDKTEDYEKLCDNIKEIVDKETFNDYLSKVKPFEWTPNVYLLFEKLSGEKPAKQVKGKGKENEKKKKDKGKRESTVGKRASTVHVDSSPSTNADKQKKEDKENDKPEIQVDQSNESKTDHLEIENQETPPVSPTTGKRKKKGKDEKKKWNIDIKGKLDTIGKRMKKKSREGANVQVDIEIEPNPLLVSQSSSDSAAGFPSPENSPLPPTPDQDTYEAPEPPVFQPTASSNYEEPSVSSPVSLTNNNTKASSNYEEPTIPSHVSSANTNTKPKSEYEEPMEPVPTDNKSKSGTLFSRAKKQMEKMKPRKRAISVSHERRPRSRSKNKNASKRESCDVYETAMDDSFVPPPVAPDYARGDEDLYEEIPAGNYLSKDIYEGAIRESFFTDPKSVSQEMENGDSGFDEIDQKMIENLRAQSPPPLPGNHPSRPKLPRRRSSLTDVDALGNPRFDKNRFKTIKKFIDVVKASEAQLSSWGPPEIEKALKKLKLDAFVSKFLESQIDGKLLIDLDEAVLRDLGLNPFEARKLRKFVFGWRPDSMRQENHYELSSKNSENPADWNESAVGEFLSSMGMHETATFCRKNQVNGDLLRDVVIDEEVLMVMLPEKNKKLNAVKLKNFVLEGWRPKTKTDGTLSPTSPTPPGKHDSDEFVHIESAPSPDALKPHPLVKSKSLDKPSAAGIGKPTSPKGKDAPVIANIKQQLASKGSGH